MEMLLSLFLSAFFGASEVRRLRPVNAQVFHRLWIECAAAPTFGREAETQGRPAYVRRRWLSVPDRDLSGRECESAQQAQ